MGGALTAVRAELHLLKALGHRLFVPSRRVVPVLALSASQNREITHFLYLKLLSDESLFHFYFFLPRGLRPLPLDPCPQTLDFFLLVFQINY